MVCKIKDYFKMICIRVFWKKIYIKCVKKYVIFDDNFIELIVVKE